MEALVKGIQNNRTAIVVTARKVAACIFVASWGLTGARAGCRIHAYRTAPLRAGRLSTAIAAVLRSEIIAVRVTAVASCIAARVSAAQAARISKAQCRAVRTRGLIGGKAR